MNLSRDLSRNTILDLTIEELQEFLRSLDAPAFRAKQLYQWIYQRLEFDLARMSNLPKGLRDKLEASAVVLPLSPARVRHAEDKLTRKGLFRLHDGVAIESVLMVYPDRVISKGRRTVCVSTQAGCGMGCSFCATGREGLSRNLSSGEIVGQVLFFARQLAQESLGPVTNVVLMGQGEPFANPRSVWKAIETLNSPYGFNLGARHITISTVGLVPQIRELASRRLQVGLAVSLHAPDNALRDKLMPVNCKYRIEDLLSACREYTTATNRRVTFEYALIHDVNDSLECARRLAQHVKGMLCHVNLIPLNVVEGSDLVPSPRHQVLAFQAELDKRGITTTVRVSRGTHLDAACGQLKAKARGDGGDALIVAAAHPDGQEDPVD